MADYFSEYSSFIGAKGLPSPADTPYETPGFIRSKRSSRATTAGSSRSREQSNSPPPLPPDAVDYADKTREGRYSALDPRRFTPTLHASLVSEILSLRRELDSKNNLVENLEATLATAKNDNDTLSQQLSMSTRDVRHAKQQVHQMETGTLEALEAMAKERDSAKAKAHDMKDKLEASQKQTRRQDDDAVRTQSIWEREKDSWENERRQLERRVHVTEARLRTFVEEMAAHQAASEAHATFLDDAADGDTFKDSGLGNDSDTASVASGKFHKRNVSSISYRSRSGLRHSTSTRALETPEPFAKSNGYSLADELGIDEEDEYDLDDFEHADDELEYPERVRRIESRQEGSVTSDLDSKAKRVLGLTDEVPPSPRKRDNEKDLSDVSVLPPLEVVASPDAVKPTAKVAYVDNGYQPSPPPSPPKSKHTPEPLASLLHVEPTPVVRLDSSAAIDEQNQTQHAITVASRVAASPISPPETPVVDGIVWPGHDRKSSPELAYADVSTQTDLTEVVAPKQDSRKRDSLQIPVLVPSIAIHPPTSRPSSPRPYVLPPGTKNASSQADLPWNCKDACVQTEEIRIDRRQVKLPAHLLPAYLEPNMGFPEPPKTVPTSTKAVKKEAKRAPTKILTSVPAMSSLPSPPLRSPTEASSPTLSRRSSSKDLRSMPLKAIPLPKPVLAPAVSMDEIALAKSQGPLNRSSQFGVGQGNRASRQLAEMEDESDYSDYDDSELYNIPMSKHANGKLPMSRFGLAEHPSVVPEHSAISPAWRPATADSYDAAPAPSIASSKGYSQRSSSKRPPPKLQTYLNPRSRSPSFNSVASSSYSTQSVVPPYPIPTRSSSRVAPPAYSDGQRSPTPDNHGARGYRTMRGSQQKSSSHQRQGSLRKVQSAAAIRGHSRKGSPHKVSPQKPRRRLRSPNLTPVQSMAFESPQQTKFPIPELPTPLQQSLAFDWGNRPSTSSRPPDTAHSSLPPSEESQLVEAIAATMVGEWMWKYIRKRKSFGVDAAEDFASQAGEDCGVSVGTHGTRHKRWVWLSPYERTIMWDSRQPTSGPALMGKRGRKLTIQAVLEVQDETPLPRKPELRTAFGRSILILTPSRALKFTAVNAERHALWMTALNFLSEPDRMQAPMPPLPLIPPIPGTSAKRDRSPSVGRSNIRDSVGLTKGKQPHLLRSTSAQNPSTTNIDGGLMTTELDQGADFPCIPRLYSNTTRHQRKRSNTSPRLAPPFTNLRSFSSSAVPSTAGSNINHRPSGTITTGSSSKPSADSGRASVTSPDRPNFFEAVGTVRMEAFVDPAVRNGVLYVPPPPPNAGPQSPRRRRGNSNLSTSTIDKRRAGYVFDEHGVDPFKGF